MTSVEDQVKLKVQAKLEVLRYVRDFIDERIAELETLVSRDDQQARGPKPNENASEARATEKQVRYALDLAARVGFQVTRAELSKMRRSEISKLIDELKAKLDEKG